MKTFGTRVAATTLAALLLPIGAAGAQTQMRVMARDSAGVMRVMTLSRPALLQRIDSLTKVLNERRLSPSEYQRISQTVNGLVLMLQESTLRDMQEEMRRAMDATVMDGAQAEVLARQLARRAEVEGRASAPRIVSRGWIGLNVEAPHVQHVEGGNVYLRYLEYPEVVSVEPNSPAEQAGVARGEVVLAFDGRDLKDNEVNVTRLLTPSRRLAVTLRAPDGDRTRVVSVRVAPSPDHVIVRREGSLGLPAEGMPMPPMAPRPPRAGTYRVVTPMPPDDAPAPDAPPTPRAFYFNFESGNAPVAGASLTALDPELGRAFGASEGLLVLAAAHGSPAREAGLRGGDVIVKAAGTPVRSLSQFRSLVDTQSSSGRPIDLEIKRSGRMLKLRMDWRDR